MLTKPGTSTFNEIMEQPQTWKSVLSKLDERRDEIQTWLREEKFGQIVLVGCGTSYHAGLSAARVYPAICGLNALAMPASEVLFAPRPPYDVRIKTLAIAISRSGETSETVWALEKLKRMDARLKTLALVFRDDTELAAMADKALAISAAHEEVPIATRTHTSAILALQILGGWLAANDAFLSELGRLPELFEIKKYQAEIQKAVASKPQNITFLGSGPFYGVAAANALLMREMANQSADFMHLLEFRHGAQSSILPHTLIVAYLSDTLRKPEEDMIREIAVMRGPRMIICAEADNKTKMGTEFVCEIGPVASEMARLCLMIPLGQIMGFYLAIAKGVNPDRPKHVQPVIKLKEKIGT